MNSSFLPEGKPKPKLKVAFDVDGTLITEDYTYGSPRYEVIRLFHWFKKQGHTMFIWSGGGVEYAEQWRDKLGLEAFVIPKDKKQLKADIAVDDCEADLATVMIYV